jgi:hypothetical protein
MTICWEIGQASRIHNHRDQNCWMSAPIGRLKVQNFRASCPRQPSRTRPSGPESRRIQPACRQHSHLLEAIRYLRGLPSRKRHLRRCPPPLHQRIWQTESRREAFVAPRPGPGICPFTYFYNARIQ